MARVQKAPVAVPPFGKTPLKHGAKVEIISLCSSKAIVMELNGGLRANMGKDLISSASCFVVSQVGAAVILQCPQTGFFLGANAGYMYGFRATEQQAAMRVYYHEDSGAIEFESCSNPGSFLAFDRTGNIIPLAGVSAGIPRQFAVRMVEAVAQAEAPTGSLSSLLSKGKKLASQAWGEGETQINFEKNKLRSILLNKARIRLRSKATGRYVAIMGNGIVHGNGDESDVLIVHHCFGVMRYAFQSEKNPRMWLAVTLDNITWAMVNKYRDTSTKENPCMVWNVDRCKADGTLLLRRNTQLSNGVICQYLGFAPNGKPTPTLIAPEDLGDVVVERTGVAVTLHAHASNALPVQQPHMTPPPYSASAPPSGPVSAPPPPMDPSLQPGLYNMPPGAMLYDGSVIRMRNSLGYICVSGKKVQMSPSPIKEAEWKVANTGFMCFSFENAAAGGFLKLSGSNVVIGSVDDTATFSVRFNANGSVSFQSANSNVFLGIKDPDMFLEMP